MTYLNNKEKDSIKFLNLNFNKEEVKIKGETADIKICPFCGKRFKMNIHLSKGVYHCPACGHGGSIYELHSILNSLDYNTAREQLTGHKGNEESTIKYDLDFKKDVEPLGLIDRNAIYSRILSNSYLEEEDKQNLLSRGLSEDFLKIGLYKSCATVKKEINNILKEMKKESAFKDVVEDLVKGEKLLPGIYYKNQWLCNLPDSGFLTPIISVNKRTMLPQFSCYQIRTNNPDKRYIYWSSTNQKGGTSVSGCEKISYSLSFWKEYKDGYKRFTCPKTINLTEGQLKGQVASFLSGADFISIPGVNSTKGLKEELEFLKNKGLEQVNICFDMDYQTNKNVQKALVSIKNIIESVGLNHKTLVWNEKFKGIDDYLLSKKSHSY